MTQRVLSGYRYELQLFPRRWRRTVWTYAVGFNWRLILGLLANFGLLYGGSMGVLFLVNLVAEQRGF